MKTLHISKKRKRSEAAPPDLGLESSESTQSGIAVLVQNLCSVISSSSYEKAHIFLRGVLRAFEISSNFPKLVSLILAVVRDPRKALPPLVLRYLRSYEGMFFCQHQADNLLDYLHNKVGDRLFLPRS